MIKLTKLSRKIRKHLDHTKSSDNVKYNDLFKRMLQAIAKEVIKEDRRLLKRKP